MFDFNEANKMLESEETEICLPGMDLLPISAQNVIDELKAKIDINPLVNQAEGYEIANVEQAMQALSMALQARKLITALTDSKKQITKPHRDFQASINKIVSDYTDKLEQIQESLKSKIEYWRYTEVELGNKFEKFSLEVQDGTFNISKKWTFKVEDENEIPLKFFSVNEKEIQRQIDAGIREIPGIKIMEIKESTLRVKN